MYTFAYHRPKDVKEAVSLLSGDSRPLAGGMTILPTIKQRLNNPDALVDLSGVEGLGGISADKSSVTLGAMATHAQVAASGDVAKAIPSLAALASGIGDAQVRHRGTVGGSLANNDPAADYPAALLALGGTVHTNKREIGANDFFTGVFETALGDDELVTKVEFSVPEKSAYVKFHQKASLFALVGVFVAKTSEGVRVAVTGAGSDGVFLHEGIGEALGKDFSADAARKAEVSAEGLMSDVHGSAAYRAHLIGVIAARAVEAC